MSTIKVTNIQHASASTAAIALNSDGQATLNGLNFPTAGPLSNRNLIINGAMQVAQRGTTFTGHTSGNTLDMWKFSENTSAVFDVAQSSTAPAGFTTSLKVDCTTTGTPSGTEEAFVETKVESQNLQHLQYGTSGAQTTTLSFWVRSNKTGDYGLWFYHYDLPGQYATTYTISSADTWEYKTITLPGNTTAAFANDNSTGLAIRFYLGAGSNYVGTPAETWTTTTTSDRTTSLNLGDSTSNEWLITGVQLEVGSVATPFEHRSYGDELARCQRYYQRYSYTGSDTAICNGFNYTASAAYGVFQSPVEMRAIPTLDSSSGTDYFGILRNGDSDRFNALTLTGQTTKNAFVIGSTTGVSGTAGHGGWLAMFNSASYVAFQSEL